MNWVDYWNGKPTVYVSNRHQEAHDFEIAFSIVRHLPEGGCNVLDFGCGDATRAYFIASRCETLYLLDAAESVRKRLQARYEDNTNIVVLDPADLQVLVSSSIELIIVSSVVQYMEPCELAEALKLFRRLLSPSGSLIIADVIPPSVSIFHDAWQLLNFARSEGFALSAARGLLRTAGSDYWNIRARLSLRKYSENAFKQLLELHGFDACRLDQNFGHNKLRMAFQARLASIKNNSALQRDPTFATGVV